jgi:hypothetical protein
MKTQKVKAVLPPNGLRYLPGEGLGDSIASKTT